MSLSRAARAAGALFLAATAGCSGVDDAPTGSPPARTAEPASPTPASTQGPRATPASGAGVYLAIGDSITFGIGVPRPREDGYVARVAESLAGGAVPGMEVIDETRVFAVPGETATGFLERRLDDVQRAVARFGPRVELVTIGLGANELLRTRREPACVADREGAACQALVEGALDQAAAALDAIVASVRAALDGAGSDARILLLAYYGPDADPVAAATIVGSDGRVSCEDPAPGLNDRIACVVDERAVELVDLHAAFVGRELELTRFADGDVHPNAAGYAVIADTILARLAGG
jgi:lysophospholipase L1-like esterase